MVVTATLKKGERGAVSLHDVRARVSPTVAGEANDKQLVGIHRLSSETGSSEGTWVIVDSQSRKAPLLNLPPDEETSFSQYFKVPPGDPCFVDVTVLGGWHWHRGTRYQWRASAVSLPINDESKSDLTCDG